MDNSAINVLYLKHKTLDVRLIKTQTFNLREVASPAFE